MAYIFNIEWTPLNNYPTTTTTWFNAPLSENALFWDKWALRDLKWGGGERVRWRLEKMTGTKNVYCRERYTIKIETAVIWQIIVCEFNTIQYRKKGGKDILSEFLTGKGMNNSWLLVFGFCKRSGGANMCRNRCILCYLLARYSSSS